jgi:hypothetical protein
VTATHGIDRRVVISYVSSDSHHEMFAECLTRVHAKIKRTQRAATPSFVVWPSFHAVVLIQAVWIDSTAQLTASMP